jgi:uncharacterized membrane protein (UPF0182 family)
VVYGNQIAMEPTLERALGRIFGARVRGDESPQTALATPGAPAPAPAAADTGLRLLSQRAWEAWQKSQEALRRGDWTAYGQEQKRLEEALRQLREGR